jgi:hypothetical protein
MDDLIGRLVANSGDRTAAERAVGIIPQLLRRAEPSLKVHASVRRRPCADATMPASYRSSRNTLGSTGGLIGVRSQSTTVLLSTARIQLVTCKTIGAAREIAWEDAVGGIVGAIPASAGLSDAR